MNPTAFALATRRSTTELHLQKSESRFKRARKLPRVSSLPTVTAAGSPAGLSAPASLRRGDRNRTCNLVGPGHARCRYATPRRGPPENRTPITGLRDQRITIMLAAQTIVPPSGIEPEPPGLQPSAQTIYARVASRASAAPRAAAPRASSSFNYSFVIWPRPRRVAVVPL